MIRRATHSSAPTWVAVVSVSILAIAVGLLATYAYVRMNPQIEPAPAPASTFAIGAPTPSPASTPLPQPSPGAAERFLAVSPEVWWRATAGACGAVEPIIERSPDAGATWADVTPRYRDLGQVGAIADFAAGGELIGLEGAACEPHALRTYTDGRFWESYPDVLAASRHLVLDDPGAVVTPAGTFAAPCPDAWGLRANGDALALICAAQAWTWSSGEWRPLPGDGAVAVALEGRDVLVAVPGPSGVAVTDAACDGVSVVRFTNGEADEPTLAACAEVADASAPAALASGTPGLVLWSGDQLLLLT